MARIELTTPGPKIAVIMIAERMAGNAKVKSDNRMINSSIQPRRADAHKPRKTPADIPIPTATNPTSKVFWAPTIIREATSRPKWSVPSQWLEEGGFNLFATSSS